MMSSQFVMTSKRPKIALPFVFTEQGVAMLSGLLRSDIAIAANIAIMRAFVQVREYLLAATNVSSDHKLERPKNKTAPKSPSVHKKGAFCGRNHFSAPSIHKRGLFCGQEPVQRQGFPSRTKRAPLRARFAGWRKPPSPLPPMAESAARFPPRVYPRPEIASRQAELAILDGR